MRLHTTVTALLAATAVVLSTTATPAVARGAVGGWSQLSVGETRSIGSVAMHRTPDGNLHTLHTEKFPSGNFSYVHSLISPAGDVVRRTALPLDVKGLGDQPTLQSTPSGALRVVYTSLDDRSDLRWGRLAQATSTDGGVTWSVREEALSRDSATWGDFGLDATFLPDGTTFQAWAGLSGIKWRAGTITGRPQDAPADQVAEPGGYQVALQRVGDTVHAAWQAHQGHSKQGIQVRQVWPTVTEATVAPQSLESWTSVRVPFVSRTDGSAWVAYNTKALRDLAVWRLGSPKPVKVAKTTDSAEFDLAAAPDGRLWAAWYGDGATYVAHTGPKGTGFSTPRKVKHPIGVSRVYKLQLEAGAGRADLTVVGVNGVHHTQVLPGLTAKAKPGRIKLGKGKKAKRAKKVRFVVTDGSDRLRGAKVKVGKKKCRTNAKGVCKVKVKVRKPGKVKAKVTRPGFAATRVVVKVRR